MILFSVNDRIILASLPSGVRPSRKDPLWTSSFGCMGTVRGIRDSYFTMLIKWDNGYLGTAFVQRVKLFITHSESSESSEPNHAFFTKKRAERIDRAKMIFRNTKPWARALVLEDDS